MEERIVTREPERAAAASGRDERDEGPVTAPDWQAGWAAWWQAFWDGRSAQDDAPPPATPWTGVASNVAD